MFEFELVCLIDFLMSFQSRLPLQYRTFYHDHVVLYTIMKCHLYKNVKGYSLPEQPLAMESESPSDQLAGMTLYQADEELPEYVSSVGSSVSQQNKTTVEVNAEMVDNAVAMIQNLAQQVLTYYTFS